MIPTFKIHSSAIGSIMGGAMSKPTAKQMELLDELQKKEKRTAKQDETLQELIAKRDAPPALQEGAKTYCKQWLKEQSDLYNRRRCFSNKYTEKGNECEKAGINLTAKIMGYGEVFKNTEQFENEYIIGTPDLILAKIIEDIKCSWDETTFPLFATKLPESDYWWQGQGYMDLLNKDRFAVNYCLIDTPTHLIDKAAFFRAKELGMDEVSLELYDEVAAEMTYPNVPDYLRFKRFEFERDNAAIQAIYTQVKLCREYIKELVEQVETIKGSELFKNISQAA